MPRYGVSMFSSSNKLLCIFKAFNIDISLSRVKDKRESINIYRYSVQTSLSLCLWASERSKRRLHKFLSLTSAFHISSCYQTELMVLAVLSLRKHKLLDFDTAKGIFNARLSLLLNEGGNLFRLSNAVISDDDDSEFVRNVWWITVDDCRLRRWNPLKDFGWI